MSARRLVQARVRISDVRRCFLPAHSPEDVYRESGIMDKRRRDPNAPHCTPETLAAFQQQLTAIVPSTLSNAEVARIIISAPWVLGMVWICSCQRLHHARASWCEPEDLMHETIRLLAERCERCRAHGFDVGRRNQLSGFWRVLISHVTADALESLHGRSYAPLPSDLPMPEHPDMTDQQNAVRSAVLQLKHPQQRTVLWLRATLGLSLKEIARNLGCSERTTRRLNAAGMEELRRLLT